jgi:ribosome modulation factor
MTERPDDNLDHYALGFYAVSKSLAREACPYAEGMEAHDQWLAGYDAALRGEKLEDRRDNPVQS